MWFAVDRASNKDFQWPQERRFIYADAGLDRAHLRRTDPAWLAAASSAPDARAIVVWQELSAVARGARGALKVSLGSLSGIGEPVFLGLADDRPMFAVDLSALPRAKAEAMLDGGCFEDLRRLGPVLPAFDAGILAYARGLCHWHRTQRHCGRCGRPTRIERAGHQRICTGPECSGVHFPRTDPAVIVLVEHPDDDGIGPRCLLGRAGRFPQRAFSTLAGFVEPGETLEQAVAREVFEESGIELDAVRYYGSQPWPFPASLMIGFHARARTTSIRLEDDEIVEADWFTLDSLRAAGDWDSDTELRLPWHDSIARMLIEDWRARARAR